MGEYADDYFREEVKKKFGYDPGSMYSTPKKATGKHHCKHCNRNFGSSGALEQHNNSKHIWPCAVCNETFVTKDSMQAHRKARHGDATE